MRIIFEQTDVEDFFEVILTAKELARIVEGRGASLDFPYSFGSSKLLNIFIRQEESNAT